MPKSIIWKIIFTKICLNPCFSNQPDFCRENLFSSVNQLNDSYRSVNFARADFLSYGLINKNILFSRINGSNVEFFDKRLQNIHIYE